MNKPKAKTAPIDAALESARNPRPVPERIPLMTAHRFKVCTTLLKIDAVIERIRGKWAATI